METTEKLKKEKYIFRFSTVRRKTYEKEKDAAVKRILFFRFIYLVALGIWIFITIEHRVSYMLYMLATVTLLVFIPFLEINFKKDINGFAIFNVSESGIYVEYIDILCRSHKRFFNRENVKKVVIDGKNGKIIIKTTKNDIILNKNKEDMRIELFWSNQLNNLKNALKQINIDYEVIYP